MMKLSAAFLLASTALASAQSGAIGQSGLSTGRLAPAGNPVTNLADLETALAGKVNTVNGRSTGQALTGAQIDATSVVEITPIGAANGLPLATHLQYVLTPLNFNAAAGSGGDDTATLQAGLNACAGKATFRIPPGMTCNISATLSVPADSDFRIDGTIFKIANPTGTLVSMLSIVGSDVSIYGDGVFDLNRANQNPVTTGSTAAAGISSSTAGLTDILIDGLDIRNSPNWPINLTVGISNATVQRCTLHDSGNSCEFNFGTDCRFLNNTVYNINDGGVVIYAGCLDCRVDGNTVYDCIGGIGIYSDNAQTAVNSYGSISNNIVYSVRDYGITVAGVLGGGTQVIAHVGSLRRFGAPQSA